MNPSRRNFLRFTGRVALLGVATTAGLSLAVNERVRYKAHDVKVFWNGIEFKGFSEDTIITYPRKEAV